MGNTRFIHKSATQYAVERPGLGAWSNETTAWGVPVATTSPAGQTTTFLNGPRHLQSAVITPSGVAWLYEYDAADRLIGIESPGRLRTTMSYDRGGRVTVMTRGDIPWRRYKYDTLGRLSAEYSPAGLAASYTYVNRPAPAASIERLSPTASYENVCR